MKKILLIGKLNNVVKEMNQLYSFVPKMQVF